MKNLIKISIILFLVCSVYFTVAVIINNVFDKEIPVYDNIFVVILFASISVLILMSFILGKIPLRNFGFYISHLGVICLLTGIFIGYLSSSTIQITLPVNKNSTSYDIYTKDMQDITLPVNIRCTDFKIEYVSPIYKATFFDLNSAQNKTINVTLKNNELTISEIKTIDVSEIVDTENNYLLSTVVDGIKLELINPDKIKNVSNYAANIDFNDPSKNISREGLNLSVNHPLEFSGYKFYLTSYNQDQDANMYLLLDVKYDPVTNIVLIGLWSVIVGTFIICLFPYKNKATKKEEVK